MIHQRIAISLGLAGSMLLAAQAPSQAFSFKTNFDAALTGRNQAKGDIWLRSVELEDGTLLSNFTKVNGARIMYNDQYVGGNTGAASADIGDLATTGVRAEKASAADIVAVLNNLNLNNIIDTEDQGKFEIDLFFENAVDRIFLWERGQNSKLDIQAIDASGNLLGNLLQLGSSANWTYAGYSIDTQEIGSAQKVSSIGVEMKDLGLGGPIFGVRLTSRGKSYNGPDWKLVGSIAPQTPAETPEPSVLLGMVTAGGAVLAARRRQRLA